MSADNGYIVRINDAGKYVRQMYFLSNEKYPDVEDPKAPIFDTLEEACENWEDDEYSYSEYGLTIDLSNKKKKETNMELQKFDRKPFAVEGVQVTEDNLEDVATWCGGEVEYEEDGGGRHIKVRVRHPLNVRQTQAFVGDWVLSSRRGFKVYLDDALRKNFDPATDYVEDVSTPLDAQPVEVSTNNVFDAAPVELRTLDIPVDPRDAVAGKQRNSLDQHGRHRI